MLSALLTALILLAVWCVPAAVAETASEGDDSAYDESGAILPYRYPVLGSPDSS